MEQEFSQKRHEIYLSETIRFFVGTIGEFQIGTKSNPSQFDCYAKALPDEPLFVLLGRDKLAGDFVELWGHLNNAAPLDAFEVFVRLYRQIKMTEIDKPQVFEAYRVSQEMRNYFQDQFEVNKS